MQMSDQKKILNKEEIDSAISLLEFLRDNGDEITQLSAEQRIALMKAAGQLSRPDKKEIKKRNKAVKFTRKQANILSDKKERAKAAIRVARENPVFEAPKLIAQEKLEEKKERPKLSAPRNCYVCKKEYDELHHFYDSMCESCGDLNYIKRYQTTDLTGQVALITGSRLKIGYHTTLMLLRAGATVVATTRFPADSAIRFSKEEDFEKWGHRLHIHGLDLRHIPSVELFADYFKQNFSRLDIIINNAAQTVRRPSGFYSHLMEMENLPFEKHTEKVKQILAGHKNCAQELSGFANRTDDNNNSLAVTWHGTEPGIGIRASAQLSQIPYKFDNSLEAKEVFPEGKLDADLQQVDLRKTNSWRLKMGEIETAEMIEVQLVNAVAPFVLINRLLDLMKKEYTGKKHIINVSAMEGKFHRFKKADRHPHTNMAKAALNMMTHTAASGLGLEGIYMNAVDTGWVTDEDPVELSKHKQDVHDFQPPLDIVDGAARVCDPLFDGINTGKHWNGKFLKDYFPIDW